jgi:hypothetical protein
MLERVHADKVIAQGARSSVVNGPFTGTKERRSFKPEVASSILVGRIGGKPVIELGTLERVDPSSLWNHEAHDFTPWLLANAEGLADALGIEVEFEAAEHRVGTFSLDLVGRDATNDTILMVENQLAGTDHTHLGQILTYAAGTGASTIVWIATSFREEHRQALDWLNEETGKETHFFGVVLEAFRIGDSPPAPHFKVVAQPNEWQKVVRQAARGQKESTKSPLYAKFWEALLVRLAKEEPNWTRRRPGDTVLGENWIDMPSKIRGASLNFSFARGGRLRNELYIDSGNQEENDRIFSAMASRREAVEQAYGGSLEFEPLEGRRAARIAAYTDGDVTEEHRHDEFIAWFLDSGRRLRGSLTEVDANASPPQP